MAKEPKERTVWTRIKEAFMDKDQPVTQATVAKMLRIEQPSVSEWNQPNRYPTMENAVEIAKRAGVCVEWLLTERGPKRPPPTNPHLSRIHDKWNSLSDITKGRVLQLIDSEISDTESLDRSERGQGSHGQRGITSP